MRAAVAALFVRPDGPYPDLVAEWWDERRDARKYDGALPVVAHPPCERWGNYWYRGPKGHDGLGDDGGCFASALASLARCGGVLEHPAGSRAWDAFGLPAPQGPRGTWYEPPWTDGATRIPLFAPGWIDAYAPRGFRVWVTETLQSEHGHAGAKATWLLYVGEVPPGELAYQEPAQAPLFRVPVARPRAIENMGKREREETPEPFARLLARLAERSRHRQEPRPRARRRVAIVDGETDRLHVIGLTR